MENRGHEVLITATEKDVAFTLLDSYGFNYINLGSYGKSLIQKLINIPILDFKMYRAVKSFKPDIFVGLGSIRAAHASFLLRNKCILFEDTEHSMEQIKLYLPFVDTICTPSCFKRDLGEKQIRYNGYHELAYLHPINFKPDIEVLTKLGLSENDTFTIVRFVSWNASHDVGQHGISHKIKFVKELEKYSQVFITSETILDDELEKYRIKVPPEQLHNLLYYASLYIGDGGTTAVESAILGTPSIYVSSLVGKMGNFIELEEKYGMILNYNNPDKALEKAVEIIQKSNLKNEWKNKRDRMLKDKIDVNAFMVNFVENYSNISVSRV
ncbi:hypothetical protein MCMEM_0239 [Methanococcoides methylutens MM1]|uniref:DUF354 domain-containing protein n=2 Tax=Methanococcoides methylutens TaxID=2226 RepID=A0A0E3SQJ8_METMT|nr:hypothetical protein MCMEM_0239 [Methanococcoides methylutens MM1]